MSLGGSEAMGQIDAKTLDDATRRYTGLRRRYWQFFLGGMAAIIVLSLLAATLNGLGSQVHPALRGILIAPLVLAFLLCWVGSFIKWLSLMRFRCPSCGKRFILSWSSSWPTSACKHCSLHLG